MASSRAVKAGEAFLEFSSRDKRLRKGLARIEKRLAGMGSMLQRIGRIGVAAGASVGAAFLGSAKLFASTGDELHKMSLRTGFSAQSLSELGFAAEQSGTSLAAVEKANKGLSRTLIDAERGLSTATDNLDDLNLSLGELQKMNPEQQFMAVAKAIAAVEDPSRRAGLAMKVFGRSGADLLPLLNGGPEAMADLRNEAKRLGITLGDEDAQAAADLTDALNRAWRQVKAIAVQVGAAVAGPLTKLLDTLQPILRTVIDWVRENRGLLQTIAAVTAIVFATGSTLVGLGLAFQVAALAVAGLSTAIGAVGAVLGAIVSPIGLVVAGLAGLAAWFVTSTETGQAMIDRLGEGFGVMKDIVLQTISGISNALAAGDIQKAGEVLWAGLKLLWLTGTAGLRKRWIELTGAIVRLWHQAIAKVAEVGTNIFGSIERGWSHTVQFFGDVFDLALAGIHKAWNGTLAFFEKTWLRIQGFFGADVQGEIDRINSQLSETNAAIDQQTTSSIGERDQAAQSARRDSSAEQQAIVQALGEDLERRLSKDDSETATALAEARKQLSDAKSAFGEATSAAEAVAASAEAQKELGDKLAQGVESGTSLGGSGTSTRAGVFNVGAIQSLLGGNRTHDQQIAANTKKTAESLSRLERKPGLTMGT